MAMEQARAYLKQYHKEQDILVLDASSATVEQAAQALGTQPERIAKSLSFMVREHAVIVVAAGDCRVDNHAYKETFGCKAKMLRGMRWKPIRIMPSAVYARLVYLRIPAYIWMFL